MKKKQIVAVVLVGLVVALGCAGGKKVDVLVTLDGKPLGNATIALVLDAGGGQPVSGVTNGDGVASLSGPKGSGVAAGTYKVLVTKTSGVAGAGEKIDPSKAKEMMMKMATLSKSEIPGLYGDAKSTPLSLTVPSPSSPAKLELKSKP